MLAQMRYITVRIRRRVIAQTCKLKNSPHTSGVDSSLSCRIAYIFHLSGNLSMSGPPLCGSIVFVAVH